MCNNSQNIIEFERKIKQQSDTIIYNVCLFLIMHVTQLLTEPSNDQSSSQLQTTHDVMCDSKHNSYATPCFTFLNPKYKTLEGINSLSVCWWGWDPSRCAVVNSPADLWPVSPNTFQVVWMQRWSVYLCFLSLFDRPCTL